MRFFVHFWLYRPQFFCDRKRRKFSYAFSSHWVPSLGCLQPHRSASFETNCKESTNDLFPSHSYPVIGYLNSLCSFIKDYIDLGCIGIPCVRNDLGEDCRNIAVEIHAQVLKGIQTNLHNEWSTRH